MSIGWREVLTAVALLFLVFLVVKMRPSSRRRGALSAEVRAARERAHAATTPRARAEALCEAGELAIANGGRWTAAAGFFVRSMRADPAWAGGVERTVEALERRRPFVLEKILWRRLAQLPWDDAHRDAVLAALAGLQALYNGPVRDATKAEVMRRFATRLAPLPRG